MDRGRVARALAWTGGGLLGSVVALALALQIDAVGGLVFRGAVAVAAPPGVRVGVGRVSGSWLTGLRLRDLAVQVPEVGLDLRIDTTIVAYRTLLWRPGSLRLDRLEIAGLTATIRPGSASDAGAAWEADGGAGTDGRGGLIEIGAVDLRRGRLTVEGPDGTAGGADEPGVDRGFRFQDLELRLRELRVAPTLRVESWDVSSPFSPAGTAPGWGRLAARGSLAEGAVRIDTLSLTSPRSRLAGRGRIPVDGSLARPGALQWTLEASPLVLADLQGLVPLAAVEMGDTVRLDWTATAAGDSAVTTLRAETSGGAGVGLDARWGRSGPRWGGRWDARVADLDLTRFLGDDVPVSTLEGRAYGTAEAVVEEGSLRSFLAGSSIDLTAPEGEVALEIDVRRGPGTPSEAWLDSLSVEVGRARWGAYALAGGRVVAGLHPGDELAWTADLGVAPSGSLRGRGRIRAPWSEGPLPASGEVRVEGVEESRSGSLVSGRLDFEVGGEAGAGGSARLLLDPSTVAGWALDSLRLSADWVEPALRVSGVAGGPGGDLELDARWVPGEAEGRLDLTRLDFSSVGSGAGDTIPALRVGGGARGTMRWPGGGTTVPAPGAIVADLRVQVDRVDGLPTPWTDAADAVVRLDRGRLNAAVSARIPGGGEASLRASGPVLGELDVEIDEGRFAGVDLAGLLSAAPPTDLGGRIAGRLRRGAAAGAPSWNLHLELDSSTVAAGTVDDLVADLAAAGDSLTGRLRAGLSGGAVVAEVAGASAEDGWRWTAVADAREVPVGAFLGEAVDLAGVTGRATVRGTGSGAMDFDVTLDRARGWGVALDSASAHGSVAAGLLALDTLWLRSGLVEVDAGGDLPLEPLTAGAAPLPDSALPTRTPPRRLTAELRIPPSGGTMAVGPDTSVLVRSGLARLELACGDGGCEASTAGRLEGVEAGIYAAAEARFDARGRLGPGRRIGEATVQAVAEGLSVPFLEVRRIEATARSAGEVWTARSGLEIDDLRDAALVLRAHRLDGVWRATLDSMEVRLEDDRWGLSHPALLTLASEGPTLDSLRLRAPGQSIRAAVLPRGEDSHLHLDVDSVDLAPVFRLVGRTDLSGTFTGDLDGYAGESGRRIRASIGADVRFRDRPLHRVALEAAVEGDRLEIDGSVLDDTGRPRLRLVPRTPEGAGAGSAWGIGLVADSLPLLWAAPYVPDDLASEWSGVVHGELEIAGGADGPSMRGPMVIEGGRVRLPRLGITLTETTLTASADGRRISVEQFRARSDGELRGSGEVSWAAGLDRPEFDLALAADGFRAMDTRNAKAVIQGDLTVAGPSTLPRIRGEIRVLEGEYRVQAPTRAQGLRDVTLEDEDWRILRERFGVVRPRTTGPSALSPRGAELDVRISLGRDVWLRRDFGPELALQFTGDFAVRTGTDGRAMELDGSVEAIPGRSYIEEFGRRFAMEEGTVEFLGPLEATRIDVTSAYAPPSAGSTDAVVIRLQVSGTLDDLLLTLSSEPALENAEIVSYLATGRPPGAGSGRQDGTSAGMGLVASGVSGALERLARQETGLDVVEIRQDGLGSTNLVAGKYVTPRLFVGFRQAVAVQRDEAAARRLVAGGTEAEAELQALDWLVLHLQGGTSSLRFFLEASYGW